MSNYENEQIDEINVSQIYDSNLVNYDEFYEEWDNSEEIPCHACKGTGMDKWEEFECPECYGEGYIASVLFDL